MLRALTLLLACPLAAAALPAHALAAAASPRCGGAQQEVVEVTTSDGQTLVGTYFAPPGKKSSPAPGALLVHDAGGDRRQLEDVALRMQKAGFGVLTIDLRGHGESRGGAKAWSELDEEDRIQRWALATRDVEAGTKWLLSQPEIHATNLSLVGLGSGCALAVRHARRDENVRCVALLAPRSKDFGFDVASDLQKIEGLPTLVLASKDDSSVQAMVANANNGSHPYIELDYATARVTSVLEDRKTPSKVASWIKDCAMPKRGRG